MSLLGIDVGTTGCKVLAISSEGQIITLQQCEYNLQRPQTGWAELDSRAVWASIKDVLRSVVAETKHDPVTALSVSSMGEAITPVSANREILGNSLMGFDERGTETVQHLQQIDPTSFLRRSGNIVTNMMGGPKLVWLRDNQPELFEKTYKFLNWADLVSYLQGGDPVTNYGLANRTLFFDLEGERWSKETLDYVGMPIEKLPDVAPSGTPIGEVSSEMQRELGLPPGVKIIVGAHDQCANGLGAGVSKPGMAVYAIGTFIVIVPAYDRIPPADQMLAIQLNVEHAALPDMYVSFYYNLTGGSLLKWFRDNFTAAEHAAARQQGVDIYDLLLAEMPPEPSSVLVLPHFGVTGAPYYDERPYGLIAGLTLGTTRGEYVRGLLEGATYYFREGLELMEAAQIHIDEFRAVGGGAKSDTWMQIKANILERPLVRPRMTEATALGVAALAGLGGGVYSSVDEAMGQLIQIDRVFEPDLRWKPAYDEQFARYKKMYAAAKSLRDL
ncbi:MAG: hypothetical protein KDD77_15050 [Caldilineaceae bacterium]|nr:hypothetical protein [Caldilineaceae bacterium]